MGAFTYAMPRCVWMPHWLRQRDAAFAASAAVLLSRFLNMTGVSVELSVAVFPSLPFFLSLSLALSLRVKSVASICYCIAAFVYLRISATLSACVCYERMYVYVVCVCMLQPLTFRLLNDSTISANEIFLQRI